MGPMTDSASSILSNNSVFIMSVNKRGRYFTKILAELSTCSGKP
ncbi:hypothetical protein BH160DRAFT_3973 [Burkholderia sp. H160]|nr:hypothetical protein BH160DRAFT_3973 [Burkholderia sp. H160]